MLITHSLDSKLLPGGMLTVGCFGLQWGRAGQRIAQGRQLNIITNIADTKLGIPDKLGDKDYRRGCFGILAFHSCTIDHRSHAQRLGINVTPDEIDMTDLH